jgi:hypothetical protein
MPGAVRGIYRRVGRFAKDGLTRIARRYGVGDFEFLWDGTDLLARYCIIHKQHRPLIVLDSAGGIGYLEFLTTLKVMGNAEYMLLLDDVHHLKHFRGLRDLRTNKSFEILISMGGCWRITGRQADPFRISFHDFALTLHPHRKNLLQNNGTWTF